MNFGWICPKCNRGVAPQVNFCECTITVQNLKPNVETDYPLEVQILERHSRGESGNKIAKSLNLAPVNVYEVLRENNVVLRRGRKSGSRKAAAVTATTPTTAQAKVRTERVRQIRKVLEEKKPETVKELHRHFPDFSYGAFNAFMFRNMKKAHRALSRRPTNKELRRRREQIERLLENDMPVTSIRRAVDGSNDVFNRLVTQARNNIRRRAAAHQ